MPIHDFGPLKKIEDAEKEVAEGKAKEFRPEPKKVLIETPPTPAEPKIAKKTKPKTKQSPKKKTTNTNHPMVNGFLEIEEEEL